MPSLSFVSRDMADDFSEYRRLIIGELDRLSRAILTLDVKIDEFRNEDISRLKVDVAMLKVRASALGAVAGALGGAIAAAVAGHLFK